MGCTDGKAMEEMMAEEEARTAAIDHNLQRHGLGLRGVSPEIAALITEGKKHDGWKETFYRFPRTRFVSSNSVRQQLTHLIGEVVEAITEHGYMSDERGTAMELMDVIHSAETALRMIEDVYEVDIFGIAEEVEEKNRARGYYD